VNPKFSELDKVRVSYESGPLEGYVVAIEKQEGRWVYEISHPEEQDSAESWDNWVPEEWLELVK